MKQSLSIKAEPASFTVTQSHDRRCAHLQPLCLSHFFIGSVTELLVGCHHLLQMFLLTAAELLVFLSLKVLCAVRPPIRHLETDGRTDFRRSNGSQGRKWTFYLGVSRCV